MKNIIIFLSLIVFIKYSNSQTINLIFPNGNEKFIKDTWSPHNIIWESTGISNFKIEYSVDNGTNWVEIVNNCTENFYSWTTPNVESTNCLIRVSELGGGVFDESNSVFEITNQNIFIAEWNTSLGQVRVELRGDLAPVTTQNFINLAEKGFYTDLIFHRVISGFMIQDGCPYGTGTGGPGYSFYDEFHPDLRHNIPGILSMANSGPNTNGSQYFITVAPTEWLNDVHSVFGRVIDGMDVVYEISEVETNSNDKPLTDIDLTISIVESIPSLNILYPSNGQKVEKGREIKMQWESDFIADAKIEFSSDNGANWTSIIDSVPSCTESVLWIVPDNVSTECLIKVTSLKDAAVFAINNFEIREKPANLARFEFYEGVTPPSDNPENIITEGNKINLKISIENLMNFNITSLSANILSENEDVSIISNSVSFNDIPISETVWSNQSFEIELPDYIPGNGQFKFSLYGISPDIDGDFWLGDFIIPILKKYPFLTVDDDDIPDSQGNGNQILEPNETIEFVLKFNNKSEEILYDVYGKLTTEESFINIWDNVSGADGFVYDTAAYNNGNPIPANSSVIEPIHDFVFDYTADDTYQTDLTLKVYGYLYEEKGSSWDEGGILMKWGIPAELNNSYPPLGIYDLGKNKGDFKILLNPTKKTLIISYSFINMDKINLELKNIQGKIIMNKQLNSKLNIEKINIEGLPSGIYFVSIKDIVKKVIILN